jgi:hypothetical protein
MEYKVEIPYTENRRQTGKYTAVYEIDTRSPEQALTIALKRFNSYENYNSASWVRTPCENEIKIYLVFDKIRIPSGDRAALAGVIRELVADKRDDLLLMAIEECRYLKPMGKELSSLLISSFDTVCESGKIKILALLAQDYKWLSADVLDLSKKIKSPHVLATYLKVCCHVNDVRTGGIIVSYLKNEDHRVRANAVEALEIFGEPDFSRDLFPLLKDSNNRVKANALKAIYNLCKTNIDEHISSMVKSVDKWHRASVAYALGEMDVPSRYDNLLVLLDDPEIEVRINAARSLRKACDLKVDQSIVKHIIAEHLDAEDDEVKIYLKQILIKHAASSIDLLMDSLKQKNISREIGDVINSINSEKLDKKDYAGWLGLSLKKFFKSIFS